MPWGRSAGKHGLTGLQEQNTALQKRRKRGHCFKPFLLLNALFLFTACSSSDKLCKPCVQLSAEPKHHCCCCRSSESGWHCPCALPVRRGQQRKLRAALPWLCQHRRAGLRTRRRKRIFTVPAYADQAEMEPIGKVCSRHPIRAFGKSGFSDPQAGEQVWVWGITWREQLWVWGVTWG